MPRRSRADFPRSARRSSPEKTHYRPKLERLEARWLLAGSVAYTTPGVALLQDFDGLPLSGSPALTGNAPQSVTAAPINAAASMEGWFVSTANGTNNVFAVSNGSSPAVRSYGSSTPDRALGGLSSATFAPRYGAVLTNQTGATLGTVVIRFTEEQWWANSSETGHAFEYKIGATGINDANFESYSHLDLVTIARSGNVAVNGNLPANQRRIESVIGNLQWAPGATLVIRWSGTAGIGAQGLAVDNFSFTAYPVPDQTPAALDDGIYRVTEDTPLAVTVAEGVLANDTGLADAPLTLAVITPPTHGSVTLQNDGSFLYTPSPDATGADSFEYEVIDADGDRSSAFVQLTISPVNDHPVARDGAVATEEETPLVIDLRTLVVDAETADEALAYVILEEPGRGTLAPIAGEPGRYRYVPAANAHGVDSFAYTVSDPQGAATAQHTVSITVSPANDAPVLDPIGNRTVDEGASLTFTIVASDPLDNPSHNVLLSVSGLPGGATFNEATGAFAWTPSETQQGSYTLTFTATDDGAPARSVSETVTVTVWELNAAPVLAGLSDHEFDEESPLSFVVAAADALDAPANNVTLSVADLPAGATFDPATGKFAWTPNATQQGTYTVVFTATDDGAPAAASSGSVLLTVRDVNRPPTLDEIADPPLLAEDASLQSLLLTGIDDGDASTAQTLAFSVASEPAHLLTDLAIDYSEGSTATLSYRPAAQASGSAVVTITLVDAGNDNALGTADDRRAERSFVVRIGSVNDVGIVAIQGTSEQGGTLTAVVSDVEGVPAEVRYQWEVSAGESGSWTPIPRGTGSRFVPQQAEVGHLLRVVATYTDDAGHAETVASPATSAVRNVNDAPSGLTLSHASVVETAVVGSVVGTLTPFDVDDTGGFTFALANPSPAFAVANGQLVVQGPLDFEAVSQYRLDVTVRDAAGASFTQTMTVEVENVDLVVRLVAGLQGEEVQVVDDVVGGSANHVALARVGNNFVFTSRNGQAFGLQGIGGVVSQDGTVATVPASEFATRALAFYAGQGHDTIALDTAGAIVPAAGLRLNLGNQAGDALQLESSLPESLQVRTWWITGTSATITLGTAGHVIATGFRTAQGSGGSDRFLLRPTAEVTRLLADGMGGDTVQIARNADITLADGLLTVRPVGGTEVLESFALQGIAHAYLAGGTSHNTFDLRGWSGSGSAQGFGNATVQLLAAGDITLGRTQAEFGTAAGKRTFKLAGFRRAEVETAAGDTSDHTFTLGDWNATTRIRALGGTNTLVFTGNQAMYELGPEGSFKYGPRAAGTFEGIAQVQFAMGQGNNAIVLKQGFSAGLAPAGVSIVAGAGYDTLHVAGDADFTVAETAADTAVHLAFHSGREFALNTRGLERISLRGDAGHDHFTFQNYRGVGGIDGVSGNDTLHVYNDASHYLLLPTAVRVGGRTLDVANIDSLRLHGGAGANTFLVNGWEGNTYIQGGGGTAVDTVRATTNAAVVALGDAALRLDDRILQLAHSIEKVDLLGGAADQSFDLTGWSHGAALYDNTELAIPYSRIDGGGGTDRLVLQKDADIFLTSNLLRYDPVGAGRLKTTSLANFEQAELTGGVSANFISAAGFMGLRGVVLNGLAGDDVLLGSQQHDTLRGGAGNDWLAGLRGDDLLIGGDGRDLLSGGAGNDSLIGGDGEDILITGRTLYDTHRAAIDALMLAWGSTGDYRSRVTRLRDTGVPGEYRLRAGTVLSDWAIEAIADDANRLADDWFLLESSSARYRDSALADEGELLTDTR
jgi:Ca2+-binding RTX toxin-like protein